MPTEEIHTVHHLASISKKYKGIIFTDKHGNLINNDTHPDVDDAHIRDDDTPSDIDIQCTNNYGVITGVNDGNSSANHDTIDDDKIAGVATQHHYIAGMANQSVNNVANPNGNNGNNKKDNNTGVAHEETRGMQPTTN